MNQKQIEKYLRISKELEGQAQPFFPNKTVQEINAELKDMQRALDMDHEGFEDNLDYWGGYLRCLNFLSKSLVSCMLNIDPSLVDTGGSKFASLGLQGIVDVLKKSGHKEVAKSIATYSRFLGLTTLVVSSKIRKLIEVN